MSIDQITVNRRCGTIDVDIERSAGGYTLYAGQTFDGRVDLINLYEEKEQLPFYNSNLNPPPTLVLKYRNRLEKSDAMF